MTSCAASRDSRLDSVYLARVTSSARSPGGLEPTTSDSEIGATTTTQRCERWLSNDFVSCSVVGKITLPMTKPNIWPHSLSEAHH